MTPTNITFEIPSKPSQACTVRVTMGQTIKDFSYTQSNSKTPFNVII